MKVLRHHDFRLLFFGQAASQLGSQVVTVALALYITRRTGSATDLAVILFASSLPYVVFIVFGGVFADRLPRHRLIIGSDVIRATLHAVLAILILTGNPTIATIAIIEGLFGIAQSVFQPAYSGLIPQTVPENEIHSAQALTGTTQNLAIIIGPVIATALVLTIGAGEAFAFDALTFVLSAALLIPVRPRPRTSNDPKPESFLHELRAGYREVTSRTWVWSTIIAYTAGVVLSLVPWESLAPLATREIYGDVAFYGVLVAIWGGGSVIASVFAAMWHPKHPLRMGLAFGALWPLPGVLMALAAPRPLLIVAAFISGCSGALLGIWWETSLARHIPPQSLSRVTAWDHMGSFALVPIGYAVAGPLAGALGLRAVLGVGSVLGIILALVALIPKEVRALPAAPEVPFTTEPAAVAAAPAAAMPATGLPQ